MASTPAGPLSDGAFARRAFIAAGAALAGAIAFLLLARVTVPLVLIFAGLLLSVFFRALADPIRRRTGVSSVAAVLLVVGLLGSLVAIFVWLAGPALAEQVDELQRSLPRALGQVREWLAGYGWGRRLLGQADPEQLAGDGQMLQEATGFASRTLGAVIGALGGIFIVFFLGIFIAAEPGYYRRGLLRIFPPHRRERAGDVLDRIDAILRWWLIGRAMSMTVVGVLVWLGLTILGMPLALVFGLLAGILDFIPYFGPILAAVPALLLALLEGPSQVLYVAALYIAVQSIENWVVAPLVERNVVRLPPALTLGAQVVLGVVAGIVGAAFASPIVAAGMALVNAVWVERINGATSAAGER